MRWVDRKNVVPPAYLASPEARQSRRLFLEYLRLDDRQRAQTRVPDRHLQDDKSISLALEKLFLRKCAFCESSARTSIYRFRPTGDAQPQESKRRSAHLYYGWLADAWQNLYPICKGCRPKSPEAFPVFGPRMPIPTPSEYEVFASGDDGLWPSYPIDEHAELLDPCFDSDFEKHFMVQSGLFIPLSAKGGATIAHFNLNRSDLITRRDAAFRDYGKKGDPGDEAEFVGIWRSSREQGTAEAIELRGSISGGGQLTVRLSVVKPPPRLTRVVVKNFKALEDLELVLPFDPGSELAQATLILGENATGKSSILEAIALCLLTDAARDALKEPPTKYLLDPRLMGDLDVPVRTGAKVELTFDDETTRTLTITRNGFKTEGVDPRQPIYAYGAYRHYLKVKRNWSAERPVVSLFRSDNMLSNPEAWLLGLNELQFDEVVRALREIFGAAETFAVIERDHRTRTCFVVAEINDGKNARTPLSAVSSGFRTVLALTCDVMRWAMDARNDPEFESLISARGIVLVDEVEAHLHPRWKIQIMTGLRRALPRMTFIATTHDPLCLRGMGEGEVKVLQRVSGEEGRTDLPVQVETLTNLPNVAALTIEQMLTSDLFGLYTADDPNTEERLARLGDYLTGDVAKRSDAAVQAAWRDLRNEIGRALPIGLGEAGRIVHEVVAEYLVARRDETDEKKAKLREATKARIRERLEQF